MLRARLSRLSSAAGIVLIFAGLALAQLPLIGREYAEITLRRPAKIFLANQTFMVQVTPVDPDANAMTERVKKLIANGINSVSRNLREVNRSPFYLVDCSITNYDFNESVEKKKLLMVKDQGTFKIITASIEASYKVVRASGNATLDSGNIRIPYKKEFQEGIQTAPVRAEVENALIGAMVKSILVNLTDTEEKIKVRLMGKGDLSRFARFAQAGQWTEYIENLKSLPDQKPDAKGQSGFEGDRHYDLAIAYESLFYEAMWKDYKRAEQYFELADTSIRKARQFDPRENEYTNAQVRLAQGRKYFEVIKERFPQNAEPETPDGGAEGDAKTQPGAMTNKEVIELLNSGASEKLIIEQIKEAKIKQFDTSSKGIVQLKNAGVSETIIGVMKNAMNRSTQRQAPKSGAKPKAKSKQLPVIKPKP